MNHFKEMRVSCPKLVANAIRGKLDGSLRSGRNFGKIKSIIKRLSSGGIESMQAIKMSRRIRTASARTRAKWSSREWALNGYKIQNDHF